MSTRKDKLYVWVGGGVADVWEGTHHLRCCATSCCVLSVCHVCVIVSIFFFFFSRNTFAFWNNNAKHDIELNYAGKLNCL